MYRSRACISFTQNLMIIVIHLSQGEQPVSYFRALQAVEKIGRGALFEKLIIARESRKNALSFHNKNPKWPKLSDSVPLRSYYSNLGELRMVQNQAIVDNYVQSKDAPAEILPLSEALGYQDGSIDENGRKFLSSCIFWTFTCL